MKLLVGFSLHLALAIVAIGPFLVEFFEFGFAESGFQNLAVSTSKKDRPL